MTVIEDVGYDSYLCAYDLPTVLAVSSITKQELQDAQQVEFRKSFIQKFCKEM